MNNTASILVLVFLAVTFIQSAYDKVFEWKGNVESEEAIGKYWWDNSGRKNWTAVQCRGGKEENEWTDSVEL